MKRLLAAICIASLVFQLACAPKPPPPPPVFVHTVSVSGETLSLIADWYTGSAQNWKAIAAANPGLKPSRLRLGDTVEIPGNIMTRRDPLTRKFVESSRRNSGGSSSKSSETFNATFPDSSTDEKLDSTKSTETSVIPAPTDSSTVGAQAAEPVTASANEAAAKAAEASNQAAAQAQEADTAQAVEAAKQAQASAEEAAKKASEAAAEAAAKAAEEAKNAAAQAAASAPAAAVAEPVKALPTPDKPKSKEDST